MVDGGAVVTEFYCRIRSTTAAAVGARVEEEMVFPTGGCQRQNGDDDKCISTGYTHKRL